MKGTQQMAFTGKATYSAGADLPELVEDVSDVIGIVSPFETPLLDALGDPRRAARGTVHEWLEDELLPNSDLIDEQNFTPDATSATEFGVEHPDRFRIGDQVRGEGSAEVMLVSAAGGSTITVQRGYGGTTPEALADGQRLSILGNAALEGDEAPEARFTNRVRRQNYLQIFTKSVRVSGSHLASQAIGVRDEMDYQMQERLRELLRDLENCVINGVASVTSPQGGATVRRTMSGVLAQLTSNVFVPGVGEIPPGKGAGQDELSEVVLNAALKEVWERSSGSIDLLVMGAAQKRRLNSFIGDTRGFGASDTVFRDLVSQYVSDFGVMRVVMSRWMPEDAILMLDSSRIDVLPLAGRSFHMKRLASSGDSEAAQVIGEYTLELRNESAHGVLRGLA